MPCGQQDHNQDWNPESSSRAQDHELGGVSQSELPTKWSQRQKLTYWSLIGECNQGAGMRGKSGWGIARGEKNIRDGASKLVMDYVCQVQVIAFQCLFLLVQLEGNGKNSCPGFSFHLSNSPYRNLPSLSSSSWLFHLAFPEATKEIRFSCSSSI